MSIASIFILAITAQYGLAGLFYAIQRDYGSALMFAAYAAANIGYLHTKGVL